MGPFSRNFGLNERTKLFLCWSHQLYIGNSSYNLSYIARFTYQLQFRVPHHRQKVVSARHRVGVQRVAAHEEFHPV